MALITILTGIIVSVLSGTFLLQLTHDPCTAIYSGMALGVCAAYPFYKLACEQRTNFLHPAPREYNVPIKIAFAKIRDHLAEVSYNYGDKWHVVTADTQTGRIIANLRFTDEKTSMEFDTRGNIHTRKERLQRFLALKILLRATEHGSTIVKLDFCPSVEGTDWTACDSIVSDVTYVIDSQLTAKPKNMV